MKNFLILITLIFLYQFSNAGTLSMYLSKNGNHAIPTNKVKQLINNTIDPALYQQIKAQVIFNESGKPDHILLFLISRLYHKVTLSSIRINAQYEFLSFEKNYQLTQTDLYQRPNMPDNAVCPDPTVQFISFSPNDNDFEQGEAKKVDEAAKSHGLKTVLLLGSDATSAHWLNYMSCPVVVGNFYDGDADASLVITHDGYLTNQDFSTTLKEKFRLKVLNIWLACEAFNNPMKSAVINDAQAQKYAAGINDLLVGPSDDTAVCTMQNAMNGKKITDAFKDCYQQYDNSDDHWGLDGGGSDYFGQ